MIPVQNEFIATLKAAGWEVLHDGGPQIILRAGRYVVNIGNQGHGELDWIGYEFEDFDDADHDVVLGHLGEQPTPLFVGTVSGSAAECAIKETVLDPSAPRGVGFQPRGTGTGSKALDYLVARTKSQIDQHGTWGTAVQASGEVEN